jgi:hypothetical protein
VPNPNDGLIAAYGNTINKLAPAGDTMTGPLTCLSTLSVAGPVAVSGGTNTSGSAAVLTPTFANGTASRLSDTSRDYIVYLAVTVSGTATSVAIGPTSTPANTVQPSSSVTAGQVIMFRLPAGWWVLWAGTTTTVSALAIGC